MKKLILVLYILSLRFGFQLPLIINYPDNVKSKYRKMKITDAHQQYINWR